MIDIQHAISIRDDIGAVMVFCPMTDRGRSWLAERDATFEGGFSPEWELDLAEIVIDCAARDGLVLEYLSSAN